MGPQKVILLACGSFNPITNMHLRMFEIARDHLHRMGSHEIVGGVVSPVHDAYGKKDLESSTQRIAMLKIALKDHDWVRLSDWECRQESWSRTRQVLHYHQNVLNAVTSTNNNRLDASESDTSWIPENVKNSDNEPIRVKLLCGADLLESFGTPGLWADEDIADIVGQHGLVVITRASYNPNEFIYNSDMLTSYMANIMLVTEWIRNEISSTRIRRALRRSESVRYLIPDKVIDYIHRHNLYGSQKSKYLQPALHPTASTVFLTPSPSDVPMEAPNSMSCMYICNNNIFSRQNYDKNENDMPSTVKVSGTIKHPGQAVKIITDSTGSTKILSGEASIVRPACL
ncbi:unnamed protein product [Acanthoscelides obtectus]|uniref:Nicotinamide-nucleotide adenylyltransferase n=1 Tax=Acanthoscelides obtectus TaxID=200917 RepID=A0A9P0LCJ1_ACAOB|nr:unnamed protein product [Acanthoscelides obtectus]CAK1670649.1 Nicotinamide/nicotinic acid mononucleotide adenylyltransferase 1 [Acanthoscelides obtectus]